MAALANVERRAVEVFLAVWAAMTLTVAPAVGQTVVPPHEDTDELRARFARLMARPDRPMPTDAAALDAMVASGNAAELSKRLARTSAAPDIILDLNWEQTNVYKGGGFLLTYAYMNDLWRVGAALPAPGGDSFKQTAATVFVYALTLVRLDGVRCADVTAPGHRQDQLFRQNQPLIAYIRTLPRERRMTLGTTALALEGATAPVRKDDLVLCSGGLDEISAGLKAQGDRPLPQVPTPPGMIGKTVSVPSAPGYVPRFVAADVWQPKQAASRAALPADLTRLLTVAGDPPATTP